MNNTPNLHYPQTISSSPVIYEKTTVCSSPLLDSNLIDKIIMLSKIMAESETLPEVFRKKPGDCLRLIELAHRVNQSPFALADFAFIISGKLRFEGQCITAIINASPRIIGSLNFEYEGDKKDPNNYICIASAKRIGDTEPKKLETSLALGLSDSKGARARWEKDPDQQLAYYSARRWARRYAPEIVAGLYTPDEAEAAENYEPVHNAIQPITKSYAVVNQLDKEIKEADTIEKLESLVPQIQELKCTKLERDSLRTQYKDKLFELKVKAKEEQNG